MYRYENLSFRKKFLFVPALIIGFCMMFSSITDAQTTSLATSTIGYFYSASGQMIDAEDNNGVMSSYLTRGERYDGTSETFAASNIKDITADLDSNGNIRIKYTYTAYGTPTSYSSFSSTSHEPRATSHQLSIAENPFTYDGYYTDSESGNYYLNARYCDPTLGIFLTSDSYNLPNRYMYVNGNPVMGIDPTGHWVFNFGSVFHISLGSRDGCHVGWGRYEERVEHGVRGSIGQPEVIDHNTETYSIGVVQEPPDESNYEEPEEWDLKDISRTADVLENGKDYDVTRYLTIKEIRHLLQVEAPAAGCSQRAFAAMAHDTMVNIPGIFRLMHLGEENVDEKGFQFITNGDGVAELISETFPQGKHVPLQPHVYSTIAELVRHPDILAGHGALIHVEDHMVYYKLKNPEDPAEGIVNSEDLRFLNGEMIFNNDELQDAVIKHLFVIPLEIIDR